MNVLKDREIEVVLVQAVVKKEEEEGVIRQMMNIPKIRISILQSGFLQPTSQPASQRNSLLLYIRGHASVYTVTKSCLHLASPGCSSPPSSSRIESRGDECVAAYDNTASRSSR